MLRQSTDRWRYRMGEMLGPATASATITVLAFMLAVQAVLNVRDWIAGCWRRALR